MFTGAKSFLIALVFSTYVLVFGTIHFCSEVSTEQAINSLFEVQTFDEVAISPDGNQVAWVQRLQGRNHMPSPNSAIYVARLGSGSVVPRRISAGNGVAAYAEHDIAWAPNSQQLAFLSDRSQEGQLQVYVTDVTGRSPRKLTSLTGFLANPQWSPDSKTLAFLFTENAPRAAGPLEPMTLAAGVVEEHAYEQRIATVDLATRRLRQVSPADLYVYEYDWSPDAKSLALIAAHGAGDANWYQAQAYTLTIESGEIKSIYQSSLQIAVPRWSPDGRTIAFIGGLMSDEGQVGGDIFTVPAVGGEARNVTPNMTGSASWISWLRSANQLLFAQNIDGSSGIASVDTASGKITSLWTGPEDLSASREGLTFSLARDEKTSAVIRQSFHSPPEVWAGALGNWRQLTQHNQKLHSRCGEAKNIHWQRGNMLVQGWLLYPYNYVASRRYPMVVSVHGGPASMVRPSWPEASFDLSVLSSQDYFVFFPNPRGSFGQGEAFTIANVKDLGHGDLGDILAGIDEVEKVSPVDEHRLGIGGWSYGGYMTMWAVTQTQRFRAAVAGAGIANWQSYVGENDIDQWLIPYFGATVYDDPAIYARSSPITFIKNVKTPTLILVGDRDGECPAPQSYEFWHALKTLGAKNQFVVYANEGHSIGQPEHRRDILKRTVEWFNEYLR
jgi:dipeptidyl aminopeptidase/acylaminoacyl peptidase